MDPQYRCDNENRRRRVEAHATLNGIDYLEVLDRTAEAEGLPRQQVLVVQFLKDLPADGDGDAIGTPRVRIEAVPRAAAANVVWARRASDLDSTLVADPDTGATLTAAQVDHFTADPDADRTLVVLTDGTGDYSTYTLRLVNSPTDDRPPPEIDQRLAAVAFSFKAECPSDFDCAPEDECPPERVVEPEIDYLAKDYASFRRLMLDRMSVVAPDWRDRNQADLQIALVEMLAYVGDHLSYAQDAVATEAYLGTARRRASVRRHARLLDYAMHDGCNARVWVHLDATAGGAVTVPAGTVLRTRGDAPLVFETMHGVAARAAHNAIRLYTWGDTECCLPAGATRATLRDEGGLALAEGDVLIFEEVVSPTTGLPADADRARRHAVRLVRAEPEVDDLDGTALVEVEWHEADALPFALCLSAVLGGTDVEDLSLARGNVVLADQGRTVAAQPLAPPTVPASDRYRPRLRDDGLTFAAPFDADGARDRAAAEALAQDPRAALPEAALDDGDEVWAPRRDLLGSGRFAAEFVAEVDTEGEATLRFGDGVLGKAPAAGSTFTATYRVGNGPAGNVGADAITTVVGVGGVTGARNPMPAVGGTAPERLDAVRQFAPQAFRTQERAVTAADYAEVTERHPGVQKAAATFRWTGSWMTVFVIVDRVGGLPVRSDARFLREIRAHIDRYRLAGYDVEIQDPVYVPLDLALAVCVAPGHIRPDVHRQLLIALGRHERPDGSRGFFHPDRFTFGQPVYLSQIYRAAMAVEGVASVEVQRFQRLDDGAHGEIAAGVLRTAALEIVRLDNDPSRPGNGRIEFDLTRGL
ncbi:putative baseplate assembly protein [Rubrivirga marina]|uniref:Putative baseplate assembly protein n=1 Tax=Rubrivirga marina TaxID=1196024 RepID=A0A271IZ84_9BACT|nr:putative baseplate assembly protein [Rubrivirga marina]PAP76015.1 putative baseplate assembly protein [Rubrivirga marina]